MPVRGFSGDGSLATNATLALANVQNICDPNQFEQTVHVWVDAADQPIPTAFTVLVGTGSKHDHGDSDASVRDGCDQADIQYAFDSGILEKGVSSVNAY